MTTSPRSASWRALTAILMILAVFAAACGSDDTDTSTDTDTEDTDTEDTGAEATEPGSDLVLHIGAIPDQEPERLQRTYGAVADYLSEALGVSVEYTPVTDYAGALSGFRVGDLDVVWFGGLTGVQARLEVEGANAIAQRDIDEAFTSVFVASVESGIAPVTDVAGLAELSGHSFTFGSESSTSGRLMPQAFLTEAGIDVTTDFEGAVGFSGSHDATIEVVTAGTYESGALNSQVWDDRVADGTVDESKIIEIFRTPTYYDYHWVAQPDLDERFGTGFTEKVQAALFALDPSDPSQAEILDLFGAGLFIETNNENYATIEAVARDAGLIR